MKEKKRSNRNIITIVVIILACIIFFFIGYFSNNTSDETILSAYEIMILREDYPFQQMLPDVQSTTNYMPMPYISAVSMNEDIVHLEIISEVEEYYENLDDNNYSSRITSYQAKILESKDGNLKKNEEIELVTFDPTDELVPVYEMGQQYIIPVNEFSTDEHPNRYLLDGPLSYYITDTSHVLSLYDYDEYTGFDGNTVSQVMKKLRADSQ